MVRRLFSEYSYSDRHASDFGEIVTAARQLADDEGDDQTIYLKYKQLAYFMSRQRPIFGQIYSVDEQNTYRGLKLFEASEVAANLFHTDHGLNTSHKTTGTNRKMPKPIAGGNTESCAKLTT